MKDKSKVRHIFPAGSVIPANCAIVIFGGGNPTGAFGGAIVQTASTGGIKLNNTGDTVTLNDGTSNQASYTYRSEGNYNQSITRNPDVTGAEPLVKHTTVTESGGARYSPGTKIDGTSFLGCTTSSSVSPDRSHLQAATVAGQTQTAQEPMQNIEVSSVQSIAPFQVSTVKDGTEATQELVQNMDVSIVQPIAPLRASVVEGEAKTVQEFSQDVDASPAPSAVPTGATGVTALTGLVSLAWLLIRRKLLLR